MLLLCYSQTRSLHAEWRPSGVPPWRAPTPRTHSPLRHPSPSHQPPEQCSEVHWLGSPGLLQAHRQGEVSWGHSDPYKRILQHPDGEWEEEVPPLGGVTTRVPCSKTFGTISSQRLPSHQGLKKAAIVRKRGKEFRQGMGSWEARRGAENPSQGISALHQERGVWGQYHHRTQLHWRSIKAH